MVKDRVYVVFGIICKKMARCPCIARHTIITNSVFSLLLLLSKTQLVMMEVRRRVQPGVQRTAQYYSICYKKQRRVVEIEIRVEIET